MTRLERAALAREIALATRSGPLQSPCACEDGAADTGPPAGPDRSLAPLLDQALPGTSACRADVRRFLAASADAGFRSVCVQPPWAALAVRALANSKTRVASFLGFPLASALTPTKCLEAHLLLRAGVQELTMVADIGALRSGDLDAAYIDIKAVAQVASCRDAPLNVFLELPLLSERRKVEACAIAKLAGASSVVSATGFGASSADAADIATMCRVVGNDLDVVAAGDVHTADAVRRMREAGADRIYTSHGLQIVGLARDEPGAATAAVR